MEFVFLSLDFSENWGTNDEIQNYLRNIEVLNGFFFI